MNKILFLLLVFIFQVALAQGVFAQVSEEPEYVAGVCVVKLNHANSAEVEALKNWAEEKGAKSFRQKFFFTQKPSVEFLKSHDGATDLTEIYEIELPAPKAIEPLIVELRKWDKVIYVERLFNYKPLLNPNDPYSNQATGNQRDFLNTINAYSAWDISTGDSTTQKIAIVDTGTLWNHEDLAQNVALNLADPINGIDDDRNGLIDDYRGWDFGDRDNNPITQGDGHGNTVASMSSARGNNGIGVAGIAFTSKFLPIKIYGNNFGGYDGVAYAAEKNCTVINLSWGRFNGGPSQFEQDVINYAVYNKNAVVVAAAGNTAGYYDFYPASYDHVVSVIHTNASDIVEPNSSSSYNIDVSAPGALVFAIKSNGTYGGGLGGSSFACPMVAGAAALLRSVYPTYSALQVGELLRINTDDISSVGINSQRAGLMGTGRLNLLKALRLTKTKSIRLENPVFTSTTHLTQILPGDTVSLVVDFKNMLDDLPNFRATLSPVSGGITVLNSVFVGPPLSTGTFISNSNNAYSFVLGSGIDGNSRIVFRMDYVSNGYADSQYFYYNLNSGYVNQTTDRIKLTVGCNGRLGFFDAVNLQGLGFWLDGKNLLGDAGIIVAANSRQIVNNVIDTNNKDQDFINSVPIKLNGSLSGGLQSTTAFNDNNARALAKIGLSVKQTVSTYNASPANRMAFVRYDITNTSNSMLDSLCFGMYTDFDCGNYNRNRTDWDTANRIGYTYSTLANNAYAGVHLVSREKASYYAIDAVPNYTTNRNLDVTNGFSLGEKFATVSQGISRVKAGYSMAQGNNVCSVTGYKIYGIDAGATKTIAFALVAGANLQELRDAVTAGTSLYRTNQMGPVPTAGNYTVCSGGQIDIAPSNGNNFKFYDRPSLSVPIGEGRYLRLANVRSRRQIYITNTDSLFESSASISTVSTFGPEASFTIPARVLLEQGRAIVMPTDVNVSPGVRYQWQTSNANRIDTNINPQFEFNALGSEFIELRVSDTSCSDVVRQYFEVVLPSNNKVNIQNEIRIFPNPTKEVLRFENLEKGSKIEIRDVLGQIVLKKDDLKTEDVILLSGLNSGVYIVTISSGDKKQNLRLVKE